MIHNENLQTKPTAKDDLWATDDLRHHANTIFLDGSAGSGKSTVLSTLIREWQTLRGGAKDIVRPLPVQTFHAIANDVPIHAWLLQSFFELTTKIVDSTMRVGKNAESSLQDDWKTLFRMGAVRATSIRAVDRPILEQISDLRVQIRSHYELGTLFRKYIDDLLNEAFKSGLLPSWEILLVVPIDDIDGQPDRVSELLDALCLFYHPQLVWLVAGDFTEVNRAVNDDRVGMKIRQRGGYPLSDEIVESRAYARARYFCEKTFPRRVVLLTTDP